VMGTSETTRVQHDLRDIKVKLNTLSDNFSSQLRALMAEQAGAKNPEKDAAKMASLALDMGTGECKLLVLLHQGKGVIVLKELASSKAVQERDEKKKLKTIDIAMAYTDRFQSRRLVRRNTSPIPGASGNVSPGKQPLAPVDVAVLAAFTDGLDKLHKDNCVAEFGKDADGNDFDLNSYQWLPGIIGATAWFRKLHRVGQESVLQFMDAIKDAIEETARSKLDINLNMKIEPVPSDVEALHEQRAVEHACARALLPPPRAILSAGSGSMQFTSSAMKMVASVDLDLTGGARLVSEGTAELWNKEVEQAIGKCAALQKYRKPKTASKKEGLWNSKLLRKLKLVATSKAVRETLAEGRAVSEQAMQDALAGVDSSTPLSVRTVHLVGMSGFAYAAIAAKITDKNDLSMKYLKLADVITKLKKVGDDDKEESKDRANCRRLIVTLNNVLELLGSDVEHADMLFLRDCACEPFGTFNSAPFGKDKKPDAKFRTTWTAGWFIERVRRAGVDVEPYEPFDKKKKRERHAKQLIASMDLIPGVGSVAI